MTYQLGAGRPQQLAKVLTLVAEHKAKIGFTGTLLLKPKPQEPTKHQYDYDSQSAHGFPVRHALEDEYRVNIEGNHATLAGHSFHYEVAYAIDHGIFGSIDANRGDYQNGWSGNIGSSILSGTESLESLEDKVTAGDIDPKPVSGAQEMLEIKVSRVIWGS